MRITRKLAVCTFVFALALPASAQSILRIGELTPSGDGMTWTAPVLVDVRWSHADPAQALAFRILHSSDSVESITLRRSGILADLAPLFESMPRTADSASYVGAFDAQSDPIRFTAGQFEEIAQVQVRLRPGADPASVVLELDPQSATLSNQAGTLQQNVRDGGLSIARPGHAPERRHQRQD